MLNILIADDQAIYRETLDIILQPYGNRVLVEDGAQAVHAFQQAMNAHDPFQLVLLDIQMPNMNGQEALLQIRQLEKQKYGPLHMHERAFVLMQSSLDDPSQLMTAYKDGHCNGYILKPVDRDELIKRLQKHHII